MKTVIKTVVRAAPILLILGLLSGAFSDAMANVTRGTIKNLTVAGTKDCSEHCLIKNIITGKLECADPCEDSSILQNTSPFQGLSVQVFLDEGGWFNKDLLCKFLGPYSQLCKTVIGCVDKPKECPIKDCFKKPNQPECKQICQMDPTNKVCDAAECAAKPSEECCDLFPPDNPETKEACEALAGGELEKCLNDPTPSCCEKIPSSQLTEACEIAMCTDNFSVEKCCNLPAVQNADPEDDPGGVFLAGCEAYLCAKWVRDGDPRATKCCAELAGTPDVPPACAGFSCASNPGPSCCGLAPSIPECTGIVTCAKRLDNSTAEKLKCCQDFPGMDIPGCDEAICVNACSLTPPSAGCAKCCNLFPDLPACKDLVSCVGKIDAGDKQAASACCNSLVSGMVPAACTAIKCEEKPDANCCKMFTATQIPACSAFIDCVNNPGIGCCEKHPEILPECSIIAKCKASPTVECCNQMNPPLPQCKAITECVGNKTSECCTKNPEIPGCDFLFCKEQPDLKCCNLMPTANSQCKEIVDCATSVTPECCQKYGGKIPGCASDDCAAKIKADPNGANQETKDCCKRYPGMDGCITVLGCDVAEGLPKECCEIYADELAAHPDCGS